MSSATSALRERRFALLTPAQGWTQANFEDYWLRRHGPLVASTAEYGMYRDQYMQDHILCGLPVGALPPFAGLASVLIPTSNTADFSETEQFRNRIRPDEQVFLDRASSLAVQTYERRLIRGHGAVKTVHIALATKSSASDTELTPNAHRMWIGSAPPPRGLSLSIPISPSTDMDGLARSTKPPVAWIEEAWFDTDAEMHTHFDNRAADAAPEVLWSFKSTEHVLYANNDLPHN